MQLSIVEKDGMFYVSSLEDCYFLDKSKKKCVEVKTYLENMINEFSEDDLSIIRDALRYFANHIPTHKKSQLERTIILCDIIEQKRIDLFKEREDKDRRLKALKGIKNPFLEEP